MRLIEKLITERIEQLARELQELRLELQHVRSAPLPANLREASSISLWSTGPSLRDLVCEAIANAPREFSTSFIRAYVRERMPNANYHSMNTAITRFVKKTGATQVVQGRGRYKPSVYRKRDAEAVTIAQSKE